MTQRTGSCMCQGPNIKPEVRREETVFILLNPKCRISPALHLGALPSADQCWQVASHLPEPTDHMCPDRLFRAQFFLHSRKDTGQKICLQLPGSQCELLQACWVWKHFQFPSQKAVIWLWAAGDQWSKFLLPRVMWCRIPLMEANQHHPLWAASFQLSWPPLPLQSWAWPFFLFPPCRTWFSSLAGRAFFPATGPLHMLSPLPRKLSALLPSPWLTPAQP